MTRLVFSLFATAICTVVPTMLFNQLDKGSLLLNTFYLLIAFGFGLLVALLVALPNILTGLVVK